MVDLGITPCNPPTSDAAGARPDAHPARFVVSCAGCARHLLTVARIRDPEIAVLEAHLRACEPTAPLPESAVMLGEIIRRLRVAAGSV